jgi:hypothetical protein
MPDKTSQELATVVERHASRFHHVLILPGLVGIPSLGVDARDLGGILGVKVSHRLLQRTPQTVKRAVDLVAAVVAATRRSAELGGAAVKP